MDQPVLLVIVIAIIVGLLVLKWLAGRATAKIGQKVHQAVNRGDLNRQNELWERVWTWTTTATWSDLRKALEAELTSLPGLKIIAEGKQGLRLGFNFTGVRFSQGSIHFGGVSGMREASEYEFQAEFAKTDDGAAFQFTNIRTTDGVARCVDEMEQVLGMVERVVTTADPKAREVGV